MGIPEDGWGLQNEAMQVSIEPGTPLIDRYRKILDDFDAESIARRYREIENVLWYRSPGSGSPALFEEELAKVRELGEKGRLEAGEKSADCLVLCVGYSPEPLLLTIAYHRPARILLLVEIHLSGEYLNALEELWDTYRDLLEIPAFAETHQERVRDDATDIFLSIRAISERLANEPPRRMVVDITGAKKSMVAGAFLAAGFLDLESSYVDFSEYDAVLRRPIPGTSCPGGLTHPDRLFQLREEARLEKEFDRRRFREAEQLAGRLAETAASPEVEKLLDRHEGQARARRLGALQAAARAYALWSDGFYREAASELEAIGIPVPATMAQLAPFWPPAEAKAGEIVKALSPAAVLADPATALAYFVDVLVWNDAARLVENPRHGYLRLYGSVESVIFFAFDLSVTRHPERLIVASQTPGGLAGLQGGSQAEADLVSSLRRYAIGACETSSTQALKVLSGKTVEFPPQAWSSLQTSAAEPAPSATFSLAGPALSAGLLDLFRGRGKRDGLGTFTELRHKATHWLAPVPQDFAVRLLDYYREVLLQLVPWLESVPETSAVAGEAVPHLEAWKTRLLAAAQGQILEDCVPLRYAEVKRRSSATGQPEL